MLANNYLSDMNVNMNNMKTLQQQLSSGKNFRRASDNPFDVARAMQMHSSINANKQYNKNITNVINWLDTTDTALGQMGNVFQSIREKLISSGNAAYGSDERQKVKDEMNQRVGQIAQILNTSFDGEYIFGGTQGASKPVKTELDANSNTIISYSDKDSNVLKMLPAVNATVSNPANWSEKVINFQLTPDGSTTPQNFTLKLDKLDKSPVTIDDVIDNLNLKINGTPADSAASFPLRGKVGINKSEDGKISFTTLTKDTVKIVSTGDGNPGTNIPDLDPFNGVQIPNYQVQNLSGKKKTEISQGVLVEYNVSASDVMKYDDGDNLRELLARIVNHLDGKIEKRDGSNNIVRDADGNIQYDADAAKATSALTNQDLKDMDKAVSKLLKVRSEVGAKQNRMDSAKEQNEQGNLDMTDILSKTEDIDITEKTMEFATMQTIYLASLQTSAKVLQPTLMDYMR